jgi:hypothetical protein
MGKQAKTSVKKVRDTTCSVLNKKLKAERHQKLVSKFQLRSIETEKLLTQARELLHVGSKAGVKRVVGTLNFNRLSDVVQNQYLNASWYIKRQLSQQEKKNVRKSISSKASTEEKVIA